MPVQVEQGHEHKQHLPPVAQTTQGDQSFKTVSSAEPVFVRVVSLPGVAFFDIETCSFLLIHLSDLHTSSRMNIFIHVASNHSDASTSCTTDLRGTPIEA
jgi:hypothetical protein